MIKYLLLCIFFYSSIVVCQHKKIDITVDDLPTVTYGINTPEFDLRITKSLVNTFKENDIPAIGYVNESKLYKKGKLVANKVHLLELWLQNGLDLGNHTFSHSDYNNVSNSTFFENIINLSKK